MKKGLRPILGLLIITNSSYTVSAQSANLSGIWQAIAKGYVITSFIDGMVQTGLPTTQTSTQTASTGLGSLLTAFLYHQELLPSWRTILVPMLLFGTGRDALFTRTTLAVICFAHILQEKFEKQSSPLPFS